MQTGLWRTFFPHKHTPSMFISILPCRANIEFRPMVRVEKFLFSDTALESGKPTDSNRNKHTNIVLLEWLLYYFIGKCKWSFDGQSLPPPFLSLSLSLFFKWFKFLFNLHSILLWNFRCCPLHCRDRVKAIPMDIRPKWTTSWYCPKLMIRVENASIHF